MTSQPRFKGRDRGLCLLIGKGTRCKRDMGDERYDGECLCEAKFATISNHLIVSLKRP